MSLPNVLDAMELATPYVPGLPFTGPWLLAPMDGITSPSFRDLVLERHQPHILGGAFTEFVRVVDHGVPAKEFRRHMGPRRFAIPVGVQLMGRDLAALATSARNAIELGVPLIDLNFGCPAKGALRGCAGAGALRDPAGLEEVVRTVVRAAEERVPVTAKIRAGYDHAEDVEVLARAAEAGGARLLTVHCRTRRDGYCPEVDWTRIARAVQAIDIPVCGNGGIEQHTDLERMRGETGCAFVMVGRAALANPWIFSGHCASRAEAAEFMLQYHRVMADAVGDERGPLRRIKQLMSHWTAGGLVASDDDRSTWLRENDPTRLLGRLRNLALG